MASGTIIAPTRVKHSLKDDEEPNEGEKVFPNYGFRYVMRPKKVEAATWVKGFTSDEQFIWDP